ncbi:hypothetical protein PHMEG_00018992 [Phytophthora megakarya]|uniref:Uncharacterized protein n=1 Tax=Phytophthora megakarya TaxID=4795 RepID=A0A225VV92_9STRA|nr:hypothetical protein PHMEG_00018992 [Phytophthora megakarya]
MTTATNYERYCGGDAQSGDTKSAIAGEILQFVVDAGVTTPHWVKDIMTKISSLETTYKTAADWLGATGQGVEEGKQLQDAILSRCSYYYQLDDIMKDRASTTPLMLNTESLNSGSESDDDEESSDDTLRGDASSGGIASDMISISPDAYAINKGPTTSTTTSTAAQQPVTPVPSGVKKPFRRETFNPSSDKRPTV